VALVILVDEWLARLTWPGRSALGQRLGVDPHVTGTPSDWATVIGVVRHVRHRTPLRDVREQVYFAERQVPRNPVVYLVKTEGDPATLVAPVRGTIERLDPALPIYDVRPLDQYVASANAQRAFTARLAGAFAAIALVVAGVGVYGVTAFFAVARRREFGVRLVLGATRANMLALVLGDGLWMTAAGLGVGIAGGIAAAALLRDQLYGVAPWDAASLVTLVPVLAGVILVATAVPAVRAARTDPATVLRG
jgi:cell division protein FtsX